MEQNLLMPRSKIMSIVFLVPAVFIMTGCFSLALSNRTNQPVFAGGIEAAYEAEKDIVLLGAPSWEHKLKIVRQSGAIPISSITPYVIINNTSHSMTLIGDWAGNISYWNYTQPSDCASQQPPLTWESEYSFLVQYSRGGSWWVPSPPAETPFSGTFTQRILNIGLHFEPNRPYPNNASADGIIYNQNCWQTGTSCTPTWKKWEAFHPGQWPTQLQYQFILRNSEPLDAEITMLSLGPDLLDNASYNMFQLVNITLPITIPACGGTALITITYTPNSPPSSSHHYLNLNGSITWPNMSTLNLLLGMDYEIRLIAS